MLDIKFIRENPDFVAKKSQEKGYPVDIPALLRLDEERRLTVAAFDRLQEERNQLAKELKAGKPSSEAVLRGKELKTRATEAEKKLADIEVTFLELLKKVPNIPTEDTPIGASETENQVLYAWGELPKFSFPVLNHAEIAQKRDWIDKDRAGKVTGARFAYIKGELVLLQFALIQFILETVTNTKTLKTIINDFNVGEEVSDKPFIPILPPLMLKTAVYDAMDRLEPRDDRYKIDGEDLWLQGSAEHVLGPLRSGEIVPAESLPERYVGYATSFRKEAGTYGKDMEGIIRMHQFDKLEMESFSRADQSLGEHKLCIAIQEYILRSLALPYRKLLKCTFDIGKPNARGVDMEVYLPGQGKYRETHTADYMTDYQARRLEARYRTKDGKNAFLHTNDATALALGRGMVAILENYQTAGGTVRVPEVLRPYLGGRTEL